MSRQVVVFGGETDVLSNLYPCTINVGGQIYHGSEYFYQAKWAEIALGDSYMVQEIMRQRTPKEAMHKAKEFKRRCPENRMRRWYREDAWPCMLTILRAKFGQNPNLAEELLATGDAVIGEGTVDTRWGIGVLKRDLRSRDLRNWRGQNWMGQLLMQVRQELRDKAYKETHPVTEMRVHGSQSRSGDSRAQLGNSHGGFGAADVRLQDPVKAAALTSVTVCEQSSSAVPPDPSVLPVPCFSPSDSSFTPSHPTIPSETHPPHDQSSSSPSPLAHPFSSVVAAAPPAPKPILRGSRSSFVSLGKIGARKVQFSSDVSYSAPSTVSSATVSVSTPPVSKLESCSLSSSSSTSIETHPSSSIVHSQSSSLPAEQLQLSDPGHGSVLMTEPPISPVEKLLVSGDPPSHPPMVEDSADLGDIDLGDYELDVDYDNNIVPDPPAAPAEPSQSSAVADPPAVTGEPPKKKKKKQRQRGNFHRKSDCSICDDNGKSHFKLQRHMNRVHLPYFMDPDNACWECGIRLEGGKLQEHRREHPNGVFCEVYHEQCSRLMLGLLHCLRQSCGVPTLEEMYNRMVEQEVVSLDPEGGHGRQIVCPDFFETIVPLMATELNLDLSNFTIFPASNVLALLHWRHLHDVLFHVSDSVRSEIKTCRVQTNAAGVVIFDPLDDSVESEAEVVPIQGGVDGKSHFLIDAHIHLDMLCNDCGKTSDELHLAVLQANSDPKVSKTDFEVEKVISNCVHPRLWDMTNNLLAFSPYETHLTFGIHPHHAGMFGDWQFELEQKVLLDSCVGVGETGFDIQCKCKQGECNPRRRHASLFAEQLVSFRGHIYLAVTNGKTLVLHLRGQDAVSLEALQILKDLQATNLRVHYHCFTGSEELAKQWVASVPKVKFGFTAYYLERYLRIRKVCGSLDPSRVLPETDAPYLHPFPDPRPPHADRRWRQPRKTNPPDMLHLAVRNIARAQGKEVSEMVPILNENICEVYHLGTA